MIRLNKPQKPPPQEETPPSPQAFWRRVPVQSGRSSSASSTSSEYGKSDGSYSIDALTALERKSHSGSSQERQPPEELPPLTPDREEKPPSGRSDEEAPPVFGHEPKPPVRNCSLKRSKNFKVENRDLWKQQQQFVTSVSACETTSEACKLKTRRVSDTHVAYRSQEGPSIFVQTTRKIFSPVQSTNDSIIGYVVSESSTADAQMPTWRKVRDSQSASPALARKMLAGNSPESSPARPRRLLGDGTHLPPPFPRSPTPCRKGTEPKTPAPSIKQMVAKYNQRFGEQAPGAEPRASTPVWRSPVLERRDGQVKAQMTKYQEEIRKALQDGFTGARWTKSVQKSASAGAIR